jgi:hypothetical protein
MDGDGRYGEDTMRIDDSTRLTGDTAAGSNSAITTVTADLSYGDGNGNRNGTRSPSLLSGLRLGPDEARTRTRRASDFSSFSLDIVFEATGKSAGCSKIGTRPECEAVVGCQWHKTKGRDCTGNVITKANLEPVTCAV